MLFFNARHLNDIHVCSKTIELEVEQMLHLNLQKNRNLQNYYKAEGEAMW